MKKILIYISIALFSFMAGYQIDKLTSLQLANYNTLPYKIEVIEAYDLYYTSTETLLDSICNQYDEFLDITMESDEYYIYLQTKHTVDSLITLEQ